LPGRPRVTRLDRYILRLFVAAFGFFVLIFTGVVWLTQAVRLIDTVVASGQTAQAFLEFSVLVLPQVFVIVLPLAGIGAALYALNRLYTETELVVMMAAGLGPGALLRPVAGFGAGIALLMALNMILVLPTASRTLADRSQAVRSDLANALIVERQFLHPLSGLTLFISDTRQAGEMAGLFLNDQRDPDRVVTYSAERALLVREGMEARLVMIDGVALGPGAGDSLSTVTFDQFVFDLSELISGEGVRTPRPAEYFVTDLLSPTPEMLSAGRFERGDFVSEGNYKLALPLLAMIYPMVALVTLLAGGYRRAGFGRRVVVAIAVSAVLQIGLLMIRERVNDNAGLWPLMYAPHLLGLAYVAGLLRWLRRGNRPRGLPA
jgi:lipopolysaccharide export system permease protein